MTSPPPTTQAWIPQGERPRHVRYLLAAAATLLVLAGSVLTVNVLVDPLWFGAGNKLTGKNFAFNERHAKLNLFWQDPDRYDCLILGSSRTTLLDARQISQATCFNFSFSGGLVGEFVALGRYLARAGIRPRLVITGVDAMSFQRQARMEDLPDFVLEGRSPPGWIRSYLSLDVLRFSLLTLRDRSPLPRFYGPEFAAAIRPDAPTYRPRRGQGLSGAAGDGAAGEGRAGETTPDPWLPGMVEDFRRIHAIFPGATHVGYVPPVSAWRIEDLNAQGRLETLLPLVHQVSAGCSLFVDFAVPSPVTWDTSLTYDGSHYNLDVNRRIAADLSRGLAEGRLFEDGFGQRVDGLSLEDYRRRYHDALQRFARAAAGEPGG